MSKKLFAFDMDGTIVDDSSKPRPATIEALKEAKAKGHKLAVATGRPYSDIVRDLDKNLFDYLIANNGAYFYDVKEDEFVYAGEVDKEAVLEMIETGKKHDSFFAVHAKGTAIRVLLGNADSMVDNQNDPNFKKFVWSTEEEAIDVIKNNPVAQTSLWSDEATIKEWQKIFSKKFPNAEVHVANSIYLDLNPKGISKAVGLENISERSGIELKDVIAFGDSGNDLQMLKEAGLGIAMGNGNDEAKAAADEVIGDNNSDAIADKVRELI